MYKMYCIFSALAMANEPYKKGLQNVRIVMGENVPGGTEVKTEERLS